MSENFTYPYNDEYMVVDELTGHYVLTEAALLSRGIDLRARLSETSTVSPENVINNVLQTASDMIYQFIHDHNFNNQMQDYMILKVPSVRTNDDVGFQNGGFVILQGQFFRIQILNQEGNDVQVVYSLNGTQYTQTFNCESDTELSNILGTVSAYPNRAIVSANIVSPTLPVVNLPVITSAFGNSIAFSWAYEDNYSAGSFCGCSFAVLFCLFCVACAWLRRALARRTCLCQAHATVPNWFFNNAFSF